MTKKRDSEEEEANRPRAAFGGKSLREHSRLRNLETDRKRTADKARSNVMKEMASKGTTIVAKGRKK